MRRLRIGAADFIRDVRGAGSSLRRDRVVQIVTFLFFLPWLAAIVIHRDLNVWTPLAKILGFILLYWFFTRGNPYANLPVRRPVVETAAAAIFVAVWIFYRLGEYMQWIVLPPLTVSCCGNLMDTIIPKTIEMFLVPLLAFLVLRYSIGKLGLGFPVRSWVPALLPLVILVVDGLSHEKPDGLLTRTFSFYIAAGLPEEFLFRGLLQSRLEALTGRPAWGLFLSAFAFGLSHLPIDMHGSGWAHWQAALENAFTYQMGVGLALGFAFQRSRNLWPLTLIHALIDSVPTI